MKLLLKSAVIFIGIFGLLVYLFFNGYLSKLNFFVLISMALFMWYIFIPADCDLLLLFYKYFGKSIGELEGKVIWITGASSGLGRALALGLSKSKVKLVLSSRSLDKLNEVKSLCIEQGIVGAADILVIPFDMISYDKHPWAFSAVVKHFGRLDILISNAGRSQRARWQQIEVPVDRAMFELNVFSLVALCRLVTKHFMSVGKGQHVVISSVAGKVGVPMSASYTGSKHALSGYFECLRSEQGSKGISISIICAGAVESNLMAGCLAEKLDEKVTSERRGKMMTAERFAELSIVTIVNKLSEVWICSNPVLLMMYVAQYHPTLFRWFVNKTDFSGMAMKLRDGTQETLPKED